MPLNISLLNPSKDNEALPSIPPLSHPTALLQYKRASLNDCTCNWEMQGKLPNSGGIKGKTRTASFTQSALYVFGLHYPRSLGENMQGVLAWVCRTGPTMQFDWLSGGVHKCRKHSEVPCLPCTGLHWV